MFKKKDIIWSSAYKTNSMKLSLKGKKKTNKHPKGMKFSKRGCLLEVTFSLQKEPRNVNLDAKNE